jgi:hypothetical protein
VANNHGNGHRYDSEDPRASDDPQVDYADEVAGMSRRERRHALRDGIISAQAQQMASLRSRRQAEPTSPVIVATGIVVVAIVVLGLGGGLPKLLGGNDEKAPPPGLLTPAVPASGQTSAQGNQSDSSTETSLPSTSASISAPPVLTERPSAASTAAASQAADAWAREFYRRAPGSESYDQLVSKVEKYLTPELADSLTSAGDPTYEALRADGGASSVAAVLVSAPRQNSAPVDTPTRISRLVNITIDITGKHPGRIDLPLLLTLVLENNQWAISDVNGGAGP